MNTHRYGSDFSSNTSSMSSPWKQKIESREIVRLKLAGPSGMVAFCRSLSGRRGLADGLGTDVHSTGRVRQVGGQSPRLQRVEQRRGFDAPFQLARLAERARE